MTKEEVTKIQRLESHEWDLLLEAEYKYVKATFPFGYGYVNAQLTNYITENNELHALLHSWYAFASVMRELGIPTEHKISVTEGKAGANYHEKTYYWLEGIK